ncbi:MAG: hypothetical protein E2586_11825 [Novosphingobium sp.]|uniref:hypothetical protein n=1 Tax=Novosphingobium sp. TaxID=1874826 RepID=UPI0012BF2080|nr:hypothetical protein [Novosphingobium sp.]MPS69176.1 hypothetical protein [Novosphingobium sp.]
MAHRFLPSAAIGAVGLLATFAACPAQAKDSDRALPPDVAKLAACRTIADSGERLACFDRESGILLGAIETGSVKVVDKEGIREVRRSLFGFTLPRVDLFGGGERSGEEEVKLIKTTLSSVRGAASGKLLFTLADGAQWQTNEALGTVRMPKVGDDVELEAAALGSYWVRFKGGRALKAHRVN